MKSKTQRTLALAGLLAMLAGSQAACGSSGPKGVSAASSATHTGYIGTVASSGQPVTGGILRDAAGAGEPLSLDPIQNTNDGLFGMNEYAAIFDVLIRYDPTADTYVPQLAQSLTSNADHTTWTIGLRPNVNFTDGTPLDSQAVKFNIERYWTAKDSIQYYFPITPDIVSIDTPNNLTVVINLKTSDPQFPWYLSQGFGLIGSPTAIKKGNFAMHPVGAGPFMVSNYTPGHSLELVRNSHYWAGPAYLDGITFTWIDGDQTKLQALQSGDLDLAVMSDPVTIYDALSAHLGGYLWIRYIGDTLSMNGRQGHRTSDPNVRLAVAYAINPITINQRVFQGKGIASSALFPAGELKSSQPGLPYDPAKATQLLDTVKKSTGWDGSIKILASAEPVSQAEAIELQAQLNAVGFRAAIDTCPSTSACTQDVYVNFNFDLTVNGMVITQSDPWFQLVQNVSGSSSTFGHEDPQIAAALTELRIATTSAQTTAALDKLQLAWNTVEPGATFAVGQWADMWTGRVHGLVPSSNNTFLYNKVWLSK